MGMGMEFSVKTEIWRPQMEQRLPPLVATQVTRLLQYIVEDDSDVSEEEEELEMAVFLGFSGHLQARAQREKITLYGAPITRPWEYFSPSDFEANTRFRPDDFCRLQC